MFSWQCITEIVLNRDLYLVVGFEHIVFMLLKVYISIKFPIDPDVVFLGRGFDVGGWRGWGMLFELLNRPG